MARRRAWRTLRRRARRALLAKASAVTDERTGGNAYILAAAWIAYCFDPRGLKPRTFIGKVVSEWRAARAYGWQ
jgi:hypothetical protein